MKYRKITRSVLAFETYKIVSGVNIVYIIITTLNIILKKLKQLISSLLILLL